MQELKIEQPETGYRHSLDPVLLSAFARVKETDRVIDLGCGVGVVLLRLAQSSGCAELSGVEIQAEMARLAEENAHRNGFGGRVRIINTDLREWQQDFAAGSFDVVVTNPPYRRVGTGQVAPNPERAMARHEFCGGIVDFLRTASGLLGSGGRFYIVYLAERLAELLAEMRCFKLEPKRLRMVYSRGGEKARIVLVEGRKDGKPGLEVEAPLIVYDGPNRDYSAEMLEIYEMK
jgi:tRNA1Val (adenine37-N6)-methyltransferase